MAPNLNLRLRVLLVFAITIALVGCGAAANDPAKRNTAAEVAADFLEQMGYTIIDRRDSVVSYVLEKSMLYGGTASFPYQQIWGVQTTAPDSFFGLEISTYRFTVDGHPLEQIFGVDTNVMVMMCEGNVIGGTAFPVQGEAVLVGAPYSIDGRTLEEVSGMTYAEWQEGWNARYGES